MTVTSSPYDALLAHMQAVLDHVDAQNLNDNSDARAVFAECARKIHLGTVPDPLYRTETRPSAIDEALAAARDAGTGFLMIARRGDGLLEWTALPPDGVVLTKIPTKQGDSTP